MTLIRYLMNWIIRTIALFYIGITVIILYIMIRYGISANLYFIDKLQYDAFIKSIIEQAYTFSTPIAKVCLSNIPLTIVMLVWLYFFIFTSFLFSVGFEKIRYSIYVTIVSGISVLILPWGYIGAAIVAGCYLFITGFYYNNYRFMINDLKLNYNQKMGLIYQEKLLQQESESLPSKTENVLELPNSKPNSEKVPEKVPDSFEGAANV